MSVRREDLKRGCIIEVKGYSQPVYFYKVDRIGNVKFGFGDFDNLEIRECKLKHVIKILAFVTDLTFWEVDHGISSSLR